MKKLQFALCFLLFQNCTSKSRSDVKTVIAKTYHIQCNDKGCFGKYEGLEFINGADIAHQLSNKMSNAVGDELKKQYQLNNYKKVDLASIKMSTIGMGTGIVTYTLSIPFIAVNSKCEAYTSFDHVGGWNHKPDLEKRKRELKSVSAYKQALNISDLKTTQEGLQEYWIQWKNKRIQSDCE